MVRGIPTVSVAEGKVGFGDLSPMGCGAKPYGFNPFRGKLPKNFGITCYTILNYGSSATILEGNFNMGWG